MWFFGNTLGAEVPLATCVVLWWKHKCWGQSVTSAILWGTIQVFEIRPGVVGRTQRMEKIKGASYVVANARILQVLMN